MEAERAELGRLVTQLVEVVAGPIKKELPLAGMTVQAAYEGLKEALCIPPRVVALVDGEAVDPGTKLKEGSHLEFVIPGGSKG